MLIGSEVRRNTAHTVINITVIFLFWRFALFCLFSLPLRLRLLCMRFFRQAISVHLYMRRALPQKNKAVGSNELRIRSLQMRKLRCSVTILAFVLGRATYSLMWYVVLPLTWKCSRSSIFANYMAALIATKTLKITPHKPASRRRLQRVGASIGQVTEITLSKVTSTKVQADICTER